MPTWRIRILGTQMLRIWAVTEVGSQTTADVMGNIREAQATP